MKRPSWLELVGGEELDRKAARAFVAAQKTNRQLAGWDRVYALQAIERLADGASKRATHRPVEPTSFWLACHYELGSILKSRKAAALDTADLARRVGISAGDDYHKTVQGHARELKKPVRAFLNNWVSQLETPPGVTTTILELHARLMLFVAHKVQEVA